MTTMGFNLTQIGVLPTDDSGRDTYFTVKALEGAGEVIPTNERLRDEIASRFYYDGPPGGMFCNTCTILSNPYHDDQGVLVVHEQYDI
jgi:hypothetical protein